MTAAIVKVVPRYPAEKALSAIAAGIGTGHVAGPAFCVTRPDRTIGYPVERVEKFQDRGAAAGA